DEYRRPGHAPDGDAAAVGAAPESASSTGGTDVGRRLWLSVERAVEIRPGMRGRAPVARDRGRGRRGTTAFQPVVGSFTCSGGLGCAIPHVLLGRRGGGLSGVAALERCGGRAGRRRGGRVDLGSVVLRSHRRRGRPAGPGDAG